VQEFSTPQSVDVEAGAALTDAVRDRAASSPDAVLFSRRTAEGWTTVTAREFDEQVRAVAGGLIAGGVGPGDRVGLMSKTRYEWTVCDYAIWTAGAVTVPIYETSSAEQLQWNLGDSGAVAVILESAGHQDQLEQVRGQLPDLRSSWQLDAGGLDELSEAGRDVGPEELERRRATLTPDSLATIIYTSGTTGRPKGCQLTHGNLLTICRAPGSLLPELFDASGSTLLFLPLAHVFARFVQVACIESGVRLGHTADIKNLVADLGAFSPTFLLSVPRVFEKIYNGSKQKAHAGGKGAIFDRAEKVAIAHSESLDRGRPSPLIALQHKVFDVLVYSKLRAAMGGKIQYAVSGGAPLGQRLGHFYRGIGVTILEGYGLTETSAPATVNLPGSMKIGTVGKPMPGTTIAIAEDGEVLVKGAQVFAGYWHAESATAEVLSHGWFSTGDLGELDGEGYLRITGRKKELIVTAGGKNVAPAVLEDRLRAHPLVSQCMVVGDQKPFIGCLVTLDPDAVPSWAAERGKPGSTAEDLCEDPELLAEIQRAVDDANRAVSKAEAIRKFVVLPQDWTEEGGEMTPSLKLKRSVVMKQHEREVEELYAGAKQ
jgi:long-chain acyl-CoA synthetase